MEMISKYGIKTAAKNTLNTSATLENSPRAKNAKKCYATLKSILTVSCPQTTKVHDSKYDYTEAVP